MSQTDSRRRYVDLLSLDDIERITLAHRDSCDHNTFVISHQVSELWFIVIIRELEEFKSTPSLQHLDRILHVTSALNGTWEILATLSVEAFAEIRSELDGTSGQESENYFRVKELLEEAQEICSDEDQKRRFQEIENAFTVWRFKHALVARNLIGDAPGTGGTKGAADLESKVFEGGAKCPF